MNNLFIKLFFYDIIPFVWRYTMEKIKPSYSEARKRTKEEVKVLTDAYIMNNELSKLGIGKKYHIITYGCQANVRDSETIKAILEDMSFTETDTMEDAEEVSVVNELERKRKWVDVVFGTHNIQNLPKLISEAMDKNEQVIEVFSKEGDIVENLPVKRDSMYKAFVNIMYGCDKFCTYCIVPYTRGKQRSRRKEDILKEIDDLIKLGYKEVTLLGQNVNAYGKDLDENITMAELLEEVAKTGIERIRFVTSHPWDFTDEMIDVIAKYENVMPYIHLPVQSGSNKILKLMGRRYTKESYLELFHKIKDKVKNAVDSMTEKTIKTVNDSVSDKENALKTLEETKLDYEKTPQETAEIRNIAQNTLRSLEKKAADDTEKTKRIMAENATKTVASEAAKINSTLSKKTAENSVNTALDDIRTRLSQDENLHDRLIENAIEELEKI